MLIIAVLTALLAFASASSNSRSPHVVKEFHSVPNQWKRVGSPPCDHVIQLQIGLKQSQFDELERHLYEVSDPNHHRYGQHLTAAEVNDLVKPSDQALELVHEWLVDNGISITELEYSPVKDWIKISLPVDKVESLLDTKYHIYKHADGDSIIRTPSWSLPLNLHDHIDIIQPTNSFFRLREHASGWRSVKSYSNLPIKERSPGSGTSIAEVCDEELVTPECVRTLYGTIDYVAQSPGKNKVSMNSFLEDSCNRSDASIYLSQFRKEAKSAAYEFNVEIIANGTDQQTRISRDEYYNGKNQEGNLDSQAILGIAWPTPLTVYSTGGRGSWIPDLLSPEVNYNEPFLTWLNHVLAQPDLPQVVSNSYADNEETVPYSYAKAVCNGFAQLGARGVSVFFGSGDSGVGHDGTCVSNDGKNTSRFQPMFPSSCPYVTTVGGTTDFFPEVVGKNEIVNSGGGFSNYFARPSYQDSSVSPYIRSLNPTYSGLWNESGRGYPDLAAYSINYASIWYEYTLASYGTSVSAPIVAAIFALVNDALIAAGKPPMGFLNPWLYGGGYKAFTDITNGSAVGCGVKGFPAVKGWDAVTGYGSPYFPNITADVLKR